MAGSGRGGTVTAVALVGVDVVAVARGGVAGPSFGLGFGLGRFLTTDMGDEWAAGGAGGTSFLTYGVRPPPNLVMPYLWARASALGGPREPNG